MNTAVQHHKENWAEWKTFATHLLNSMTASTKLGKIASSLLSLMDKPKLYIDLLCMCAFSKYFFTNHFKWLQGHKMEAHNFGFRSQDMAAHSFIMKTDLENLHELWKTQAAFNEFHASCWQ